MKKIIGIMILVALLISLVSCTEIPPSTTNTEQKVTEINQERLLTNQPVPQIDKSLERENLIKRLQLLNDQNKVFYVYLISYGKVMAFYTAQGKVSSLNTYLTGKDKIVRNPNGCASSADCYFSMESPDIDGTYGSNADGVFFFTTEGAYVEWKGEYMVSDYPLKLSTPPELVKTVN